MGLLTCGFSFIYFVYEQPQVAQVTQKFGNNQQSFFKFDFLKAEFRERTTPEVKFFSMVACIKLQLLFPTFTSYSNTDNNVVLDSQ